MQVSAELFDCRRFDFFPDFRWCFFGLKVEALARARSRLISALKG